MVDGGCAGQIATCKLELPDERRGHPATPPSQFYHDIRAVRFWTTAHEKQRNLHSSSLFHTPKAKTASSSTDQPSMPSKIPLLTASP